MTQDGKVLTVSGKARGDGVEINGGKAKIKVRGGKHEFRVE